MTIALNRVLCLLVAISFLIATPGILLAQQNIISSADVAVETSPRIPGPLEDVEVQLNSFVIDLDASRIVWTVNGEQRRDAIGAKSLTVRTGNIGEPTFIDATVFWSGLNSITKRIQINPGYIDLLWETVDSYTPPFYRGKALPTSESSIRVLGLTHDSFINDQYVYTWRRKSSVDQDQSGFAAQSFVVKNTFFESDYVINAQVTGRQSPFQAEANLIVPRFDPEIRFRVEDAAGNRILPTLQENIFSVGGGAHRLIAEPYFFSTTTNTGILDTTWSLDGEDVPQENTQGNVLIFSPPPGNGFADIDIAVNHKDRVLQTAEGSTRIVY